jgi:hypothetical protein
MQIESATGVGGNEVLSTVWLWLLWMPVMLGTALAAGPGGTHQGVAQTAATSTCDWTGNWDVHWLAGDATMSLTQEGAAVTGGYAYNGGALSGTVQGGVPMLPGPTSTWSISFVSITSVARI